MKLLFVNYSKGKVEIMSCGTKKTHQTHVDF